VDDAIKLFRNKELTQKLYSYIKERVKKNNNLRILEFCGTHTHNIFQYGFRYAFLPHIRFIAGPGCPVCVTSDIELALAFYLLEKKGVVIITYGDLLKVPYNGRSLSSLRSEGYQVEIVYSAIDALNVAKKTDKECVFLGVGFETTMPGTAALIELSKEKNIKNLSVLSFHKNTKAIIKALGNLGELKTDGILLPGHVSAVVGWEYFSEISSYSIPAVVVGFEPLDILLGLNELLDMIEKGERSIKCAYKRAVSEKGNRKMLEVINKVFKIVDCLWRGIGMVKDGGFDLSDEYDFYNAKKRFSFDGFKYEDTQKNCMCGDVLMGMIEPYECPSYEVFCTPDTPIGPCMVSHEGTCLAYYKWSRVNG
jgi:hydrogenase expression/formation protein HypD